MKRLKRFCALFLLLLSVQMARTQTFPSTPITAGYRDFNYGSTPHGAITAEKPESKLWWTDGFWWGYMWDKDVNEYKVYRFNKDTPSWIRLAGTGGDNRAGTLVDVLWDDATQKLYVASYKYESTGPSQFRRYSYNTSTKTYSLDSGYPVDINNDGPEALTIDKDSTGKIWAAWMVSGKVWVNCTQGADNSWGSPFQLPVQGNNGSSDDICAITNVYGNKIGIMWSNQSDKKTYFALHLDADNRTTWQAREEALADATLGKVADDHINFGMSCDNSGNVYAVTKTSLSGSDAPLIFVLKRTPNGTWTRYQFGAVANNHTRAIMVIDSENRVMYVFARTNDSVIRMKTTSLDDISFASGLGTAVIQSSSDRDINDASSTKQCLNGTTDLLILASDEGTKNYFHYFIDLPGGNVPDIAVSPTQYDYGAILVGTNSTKSFQIKNEGTQDLHVSSLNLPGPDASQFTITSGGSGFTLSPTQTQNVNVRFNPTTTGIKNATLRIDSDDPNESPFFVPITGKAVNSIDPDIRIVPVAFNYGNVFQGVSSSKTFKIYNDGVNNLVVSSTSITGTNPSDFNINSGGGGYTLAAGDSHSTVVTFTPSVLGDRIANLRISSNDPDQNPLDTPLSGIGVEVPSSGGQVAFEDLKSGSGTGVSVATSTSVTSFPGHFYVAAITYRGSADVISVTGLGLTWVQADEQCSGRGNTGVEIWRGQGIPSGNGVVTATFVSSVSNSVIIVARYSGVDQANPFSDIQSANSNGVNGTCSGGVDGINYSFNMNASLPGSLVFGAAVMRNKTHTPGANYIERAEVSQGSGGEMASLAVQERALTLPGVFPFNGTFSGVVDWAAASVVMQPGGGGGGGSPDITLNPTSQNYGDVGVGSSSSKSFAVTNTGSANLNVSGATIQGSDSGMFSISSGGGSFTLSPGQNRQIQVSFLPTSTGQKSASLKIDSNAPGKTTVTAGLSGNGVVQPTGPEIDITPASFDYGSVAVSQSASNTFIVNNAGDQNLNVTSTSLVGTNAADFNIASGGGSFTLTPGNSRNISVGFSPSASGGRSATLRIASNDADENPLDVPLTGTGTSGGGSGGNVVYQETQSGTSTSANTVATSAALSASTGSLYLAGISTRPSATVLSVSGLGLTWTRVDAQCPGRGQTSLELWKGVGTPSGSGVVTAILSASVSAAGISVSRYSGVDTGAPISTIIAGNTLGLDGACSGGTDNNSYSFQIIVSASGTIVHGVATMRNKTHTPGSGYAEIDEIAAGSGGNAANLAAVNRVFNSSGTFALNGQFDGAVDWAVIGVAIKPGGGSTPATPDIAASPESHNYGSVTVGSSGQKTFQIQNTGTANLNVTATTLVGTNASEFSITGGGAFVVTPGNSQNVQVNFNPASSGAKSATLRIASNDPDENPFDIAVSGTGGSVSAPDITVLPASKNYGDVVTGSTASQTFKIRNDGNASLNITGITKLGTDSALFTISGSTSFSLSSGDSQDIQVVFAPTTTGSKTATVRIASNDPDENPLDIALSGNGTSGGSGSGQVVFQEAKSGSAAGVNLVATSAAVTGAAGGFYVAAVSFRTPGTVTSVSGLGLTWTHLLYQCAGRNQTGVDVWYAVGSPSSDGVVTAAFSANVTAAIISVHRYSGVNNANPIGAVVSGNTNGLTGSCSGGTDSNSYEFNINTSVNGAMVYGAAAVRNRTHTPGVGFTERVEISAGSSGNLCAVATQDRGVGTAGSISLAGTLSAAVDWAVIGMEIRPASATTASLKLAKQDLEAGDKLGAGKEPNHAELSASSVPTTFALYPNYPNPFNAQTTITYDLPEAGHIVLVIYNTRGQEVARLKDGYEDSGTKRLQWDGRSNTGLEVGSGVYFLRLQAGGRVWMQKLTLQK